MHFVINYNDGRMVILFRGDVLSAINYYNRNTGCSITLIKRGLNKYKFFEYKCLYILNPDDVELFRRKMFDKIGELCDFIKVENRNVIINKIIF